MTPERKDKVIVANGEFITTYVDKVRIISTRDGIDTIMYVDISDVPFDLDIDDIDLIIGIDFLQKNGIKLVFSK